jgi:hypothetical protein
MKLAPDSAALRADPLADHTIATMLGECGCAPDWATIGIINRQFEQWQSNAALAHWHAGPAVPSHVARPLEAYVRAAMALPEWADPQKIARAETLFFDYSMLSCTLLFCSSLPECYVIPDLAAVLHMAGQLEAQTDYRVRSTAAMIFPVMMHGGLTGADGSGVAQIVKVRLIHATIRYLILRGDADGATARAPVQPLAGPPPEMANMHQSLFAHGWDAQADGLPCNQEELAYTLLTFGYVFLRSMRKLGLGLSTSDEEAYLHAWNVVGHVLGIERALMPETMAQAATMFADIQKRGRLEPYLPDHRPALGRDLMKAMEAVIPLPFMRRFPVLMTRYLCGKDTARDVGLDGRVGLFPRLLFVAGMLLTRGVDALVRLFVPEFSLCRMLTRVVGYHFIVTMLMDETRPLKLPPALLNSVADMTGGWKRDPKAPAWVNKVEQRLTSHSVAAPGGAKA